MDGPARPADGLPAPTDEQVAAFRAAPPSLGRTLRSFGFAYAGLAYLVQTQPNVRVHLAVTVIVVAVAVAVQAPLVEVAVLLLAIGLVLVGEALNTALEAVADLVSPNIHPVARIAKDVAAAGVLLAAVVAALAGVLILGPRLWRLVAA